MQDCLNSAKLKVDVSRLVRGMVDEDDVQASFRLAFADEGLCLAESGDLFRLDLVLERLHGGIRAHGRLRGEFTMECSRCLEGFAYAFDLPIDEVYSLRSGIPQELQGATTDEGDSYVVRDGVLDLNQAVNDAVLLAMPMKPLCRPDCAGLCKFCGTALNTRSCGCESDDIDPRLEVLKRFLDPDQG